MEDELESGNVKLKYILPYFQAMGIAIFGTIMMIYFANKAFEIRKDVTLQQWTANEDLQNFTLLPAEGDTRQEINLSYLQNYAIWVGLIVLAMVLEEILNAVSLSRAAIAIHNMLLTNVLRSPMSFFDATPVGRIVNRFSQDLEPVDGEIYWTFKRCLGIAASLLSALAVISYSVPNFLFATIPIFCLFNYIRKRFVSARRQLSRLGSKFRAPIFSHLSESINGSAVIRAFRKQEHYRTQSEDKLNALFEIRFMDISMDRWFGLRIAFIHNVIFFVIAFYVVIERDLLGGALIGLTIQYTIEISRMFHDITRNIAEFEKSAVSIERVIQYSTQKTEAPLHTSILPKKDWPNEGTVEIKNYGLRYRDDLDLVLKNIDVSIKPGEKVGIVGRTGAGKSSLTLGLFRLVEPASGSITIDDYDVSTLGLFDLRSNLTILPQDPILFSGTLRTNLDPLGVHSDEDIYTALEHSHLKSFVDTLPDKLDYECGEGGQNLSMGQRQLICLTRSLLRKSNVLVLDEATAAVDMKTDELIQKTIKEEFKECTVLTIAHRLNTIIDYDRILVLERGEVKEFDRPQTLLANQESVFYQMAKDAGLVGQSM